MHIHPVEKLVFLKNFLIIETKSNWRPSNAENKGSLLQIPFKECQMSLCYVAQYLMGKVSRSLVI